MIPSIEAIVDGLVAGTYTPSQAVSWLHQHAAGAVDELRDYFAAEAMPALLTVCQEDSREAGVSYIEHCAGMSYTVADAMLKARTAS